VEWNLVWWEGVEWNLVNMVGGCGMELSEYGGRCGMVLSEYGGRVWNGFI